MNQAVSKPPSIPIEVLRLFYEFQERQISGQLRINFVRGKCLVNRMKMECDVEKMLTVWAKPDKL